MESGFSYTYYLLNREAFSLCNMLLGFRRKLIKLKYSIRNLSAYQTHPSL